MQGIKADLSPEDIQNLCNEYLSPTGTIEHLRKKYRIGRDRILRILASHGITRKSRQEASMATVRATGRGLKTKDEILPSGSVIHWSHPRKYVKGVRSIKVTCGGCGRSKYYSSYMIGAMVGSDSVSRKRHSGLCPKCGHKEGPKNPRWKGGRRKTKGYIEVHYYALSLNDQKLLGPMYKKANRYVREHRLVMAKHLNRPLRSSEIVHHLNGVRDDNRLKNLKLVNKLSHPAENKAMFDMLKTEIARLQAILDEHDIDY